MTEAIRQLAAKLEEHGTTRANFRSLSESERELVARPLVQARSQCHSSNADWEDPEPEYLYQMERKKLAFFYRCGEVGISQKEAIHIWWSAVYRESPPSPQEERRYV